MGSPTPHVTFETTLSAFGNNAGIVVPPELIDNIDGAKSDDTRARRIAKSVDLFLAGKPR